MRVGIPKLEDVLKSFGASEKKATAMGRVITSKRKKASFPFFNLHTYKEPLLVLPSFSLCAFF